MANLNVYKQSAKVIFMSLALCVCASFKAKSADVETVWSRLLISYGVEVKLWGYNMSESNLDKTEFWKDDNWKSTDMFSYRGGDVNSNITDERAYTSVPWVTQIDESHVAIHNLLKSFQGLFSTTDDLVLVGEVDFDKMKITIQPQEYADGYYFASANEGGNNQYSFDELKPVIIDIDQSNKYSNLWTHNMEGSTTNAFALYTKSTETSEIYSASIGQCGFSITGRHKVVSYIFNPTYITVLPTDNPVTEIQSIILSMPSQVYENPNITAPITVKKGDETLDVSVTNYPDRDNSYRYVIEFETPLTEVGSYSITIPQGLIGNKTYNNNGFTNGNANPELTYTFTIVDIEKLEYDFDLVSSTPANGETLDRLSQFKLTFASPVSINEVYVSDIKGIGNGTVTVDESDANSVIITLGSEIVNAGEDTFSFPQGVFGDAKYGENFTVGHANPAFEVKYTISGKYQLFFDLEPTEINPKSYETYDEVTEAKITFDVPVVINEEVAATAFMYKDSYQQSNPISSIAVSPDDDKTVIITFSNPLVEAGIYDITIPQGSIGDATYGIDYTYGHANKEFRFRYTITGNLGIDGVMMDGENGDVEFFNMQGVKVNKENLAPGIYIRKSGNKAEKVCIR